MILWATGTLQPPVFTSGEKATLFRVEVVEDIKALVDGDVVGIRQELQLLVDDIMGEVEVVADEEREGTGVLPGAGEDVGGSGPGKAWRPE